MASLIQHINKKRPRLKATLCYVASWNLKTGRYFKGGPNFANLIDRFLRQDEKDFEFSEITALVVKELKQDEEKLEEAKANGVTVSSTWTEEIGVACS